jgi:ubiquinone biosynthesis protein COQ9
MKSLKANVLTEFLTILENEPLNANILYKISLNLQEPKEIITLLFPYGILDIIKAIFASENAVLEGQAISLNENENSLTKKVKNLTNQRFSNLHTHRTAFCKITKYLSTHHPLESAKQLANSVDLIWRLTGDAPTDFSYHTKRTILAKIYALALARFCLTDGIETVHNQINNSIDFSLQFFKKKTNKNRA